MHPTSIPSLARLFDDEAKERKVNLSFPSSPLNSKLWAREKGMGSLCPLSILSGPTVPSERRTMKGTDRKEERDD